MNVSHRVSSAGLLLAFALFALSLPWPTAEPEPCGRPVEVAARDGHTTAVSCSGPGLPEVSLRGPVRRLFGLRIDVNSADAATLESLPGIGPARAAAIVAERGVRPFASVDDLRRVSGLGPVRVGRLRGHVAALSLALGAGSR